MAAAPQNVETIVTVIIAGSVAGAYARKQLGGMSGDIAGYMICWGELAGIIALTLLI
jgi:adenosylcobinamide-GDP ribazoletransferase